MKTAYSIPMLVAMTLMISLVVGQSIPQIQPVLNTVNALTQYSLSYFSVKQILSTSFIQVNFNSSNIQVPNGALNCTVSLNSNPSTNPKCSCLNSICKLEFNQAGPINTKVSVSFGNLRNPHFTSSQSLQIRIYFGPNITPENYMVVISRDIYKPMPITINSFNQSDYGVGITNVTYIFNLSLTFIPKNPSLQITVPDEISRGDIKFELNFYGTVQNIQYLEVSTTLVFQIVTQEKSSPSGFLLLKITGFTNPKFIGNSSSFIITILETQMQSNCASCRVAQLISGLQASSDTPGDVQIISFISSNLSVSSSSQLNINMKLFAPIPIGGKVSIRLPLGIQPKLPVSCENYFGFIITTTTQTPYCIYNQNKHSIDTVNFAYPYLISQGSAIMSVDIINAPDSRINSFSFQTIDNISRLIGKSRTIYNYSAQPLSLNAVASKNSTEIDTPFRMNINMTLQTELKNGQKIKVIIPGTQIFQTSIVKCISSSLDLNCTASTKGENVQISLNPPCVSCGIGSVIFFFINGMNPSFINQNTENVYIQTVSSQGIIEATTKTINLKMGKLDISSYTRFGGTQVGDNYNSSLIFQVPAFIRTKGGRLELYFGQNIVYTDVEISSGSYSLKQSLSIINNGGVKIDNTIQYYQNSKPYSIQSIFAPICKQQCTDKIMSVNLLNLKQPFSSASVCCWTVRASTVEGWAIAETSINTTSYSPKPAKSTLILNVSNSVANKTSTYTFTFTSDGILIDSPLIVQLPSTNKINGNGCYVTTNVPMGFNFDCIVLNSSHISVEYSGDPTLMISSNIVYSLTISNVTNPPALVPLTYSIQSKVNGFISQEFTASYTVQQPYDIPISVTKSNNTYGQATNLSLLINQGNVLNYTKINIRIPKSILTLSSSTNSALKFTQNATDYLLQIMQSSDFPGNKIRLDAFNPYSTVANDKITVLAFFNGYLSGRGSVQMIPPEPMLLKSTIEISNKTVGSKFDMKIKFQRVNPDSSEQRYRISIPSDAYDLNSVKYQGQSLPSTRILQIGISIQSINIKDFYHLKYIPNASKVGQLVIETLNSQNQTISKNTPNMQELIASVAAQSQVVATRDSNKSNFLTQIKIDYSPLYAYSGCLMLIQLPQKQTLLTETTSCNQGLQSCSSFSKSNSNSQRPIVKLTFQANFSIVLKNVMNLYPSFQTIDVTLLTPDNLTIEKASYLIQPQIVLQPIITSFSLGNGNVATNTVLSINATTVKEIQQGSSIQIQFDESMFTKWSAVNPTICSYLINGITYTSCSYTNGTDQWLKTVTLNSLGPFKIVVNQTIRIKLYLTNAWSAYPFNNKMIKINVLDPSANIIAQGSTRIAALFQFQQSFNPIELSNVSVSSSSLLASFANTLKISFRVPVFTPAAQTYAIILIPRESFSYSGADLIKTDAVYFYIRRTLDCLNKNCNIPNNTFDFSVSVINSQFPKIQPTDIIVYTEHGSQKMSVFKLLSSPVITPNKIAVMQTFERTNNKANQNTLITIIVQMPSTLSQLDITIQGKYGSMLKNYTSIAVVSGNLPTSVQQTVRNEKNELFLALNGLTSQSINITIGGANPLLVPKSGQEYIITISNSSHFLYRNKDVTPKINLIPISTGVSLIRSTTTVGQTSQLNIEGQVLQVLPGMTAKINLEEVPILSNQFNVKLKNIVNPYSVNEQVKAFCEISNSEFIVFKNSNLLLTPPLTPVILPTVIEFPRTIFINTEITISIDFLNPVESKTFNFSVPKFLLALTKCRACNDKNQCNIPIVRCEYVPSQNAMIMVVPDNSEKVTKIRYSVQTVRYHTELKNSKISISHSPPSGYYEQVRDIAVLGITLQVSVNLTSWKVNALSNYTIRVKPIKNNGVAIMSFPPQLIQQSTPIITDSAGNQLTLAVSGNGSINYTYSNNLPTQFVISFFSIKNPKDNRPLTFTFFEAELNNQSLVYGYDQRVISMSQLELITVYQAKRNIAKVSLPIILTLSIHSPSEYSDTMLISLSQNQVRFPHQNCLMKVDGVSHTCTYKGNNLIETLSVAGNHTYVIYQGISNALISVHPTKQQKVSIKIGSPYTRAKTLDNSTVFILPYTIAGTIDLLEDSYSNKVRLSRNTLSYKLNFQHWQQYTSIVFNFANYNYFITNNPQCMVNGERKSCLKNSDLSVRIDFDSNQKSSVFKVPALNISISNVYNFIKDGDFEISSIKLTSTGAQGNLDVYRSSNVLNRLTPAQHKMRVIIPYNYVRKEQEIIVIFDTKIPLEIPVSDFKLNISVNKVLSENATPGTNLNVPTNDLEGCVTEALDFNDNESIKLTCQFTTSGQKNIKVSLYHKQIPNEPLALSQNQLIIYSQPTSQCLNSNCDLCSTYQMKEICHSCREGLSSDQGNCVSKCPQGKYSHAQSNRCLLCSPICKTCFNANEDNCLSCTEPNMVLDSGTCRENCTSHINDVYDNQLDSCVTSKRCQIEGCRTCSNNGFCYECLPDFEGEPNCSTTQLLPPMFLTYFILPFVGFGFFVFLYICIRCLGAQSILSWVIFSCSLTEMLAWILAIPLMTEHIGTMISASIVLLRIILGIASYQIYYLKIIDSLSQQLLLEDEKSQNPEKEKKKSQQDDQQQVSTPTTWKVRLVKFMGHFLGPDSYQLFRVRIGQPTMSLNENTPFLVLSIIIRVAGMGILGYLIAIGIGMNMQTISDRFLIGAIGILSSVCALASRLMLTDRVSACLNRLR